MTRPFSMFAGFILLIVAVAHIVRIFEAWPITIGSADIPMWASWAAAIGAGVVGFMTLREARK